MISLILDPDGTSVSLRLTEYLGGERFTRYREIVSSHGGRYVPAGKVNRAAIEAVPGLLRDLADAGMAVEVDPQIAARLQSEADEATALLEAGRARLAAADAQLAPRGLRLYPYQRTGIEWLAPRKRALLADPMGMGKEQPVDTLVMTPTGWRPIGTLRPSDEVIGSNGRPTRVIGVFPRGARQSYRVSFSDGSSVETGLEHLWTVAYRCGGKRWRELTLTTQEIMERPTISSIGPADLDLSKTTLHLPMLSGPAEFAPGDPLPIPPYTMGTLIANGCCGHGTPRVVVWSRDAGHVHGRMRMEGARLATAREYGSTTHVHVLEVTRALRGLGLDVGSRDKFIPAPYLRASAPSRIALLHGLMDGDGSVSRSRNRVSYHTTSRRLAEDVASLVEALGGIASVRTYDRNDEGKPTDYQVRIRTPRWAPPFSLPRKADRCRPGKNAAPRRTVLSVAPARMVEQVCISVEAEDGLYLTEHCILTHNTVQALLALPERAACMVVAPAAVSRNWLTEAERWRPDLDDRGKIASQSAWIWPRPGQVLVCTYGCLPVEGAELPEPPEGLVVIADECHLIKTPKAARTQRFRVVSQAARDRGGCVWFLTGTPLLNRPPELWAVLQAAGLAEEAFSSWPRFVAAFNGYKGRWGYEWGRADESVPELLRKVSLRRNKAEVLDDLPAKTHRDLPVNGLDRETVAACDEVLAALEGAGASIDEMLGEVSASGQQILFERMSRARAMLATAKIPALLELVESYEEEEEPVVVFSAHLPPVEALGAREGWAKITGAVSADERARIVADFQTGKLRGVAGTIQAMGVGVTLTHASHVIMVDLAWTPALNAQAEDRLHRIGQRSAVLVTRMVADHKLDRRVTELLAQKQAIIEASVEASAVQADHMGTSPAAELAQAAQQAQEAVEQAEAVRSQVEVERAEQEARVRAEVQARLNGQGDGRQVSVSHDGRFRGPANPIEDHAARAMLQLAGMDPDYAHTRNGVGFSRYDGEFGHSLAEALQRSGRLSDKQWVAAVRLATRYRRQVGVPEE